MAEDKIENLEEVLSKTLAGRKITDVQITPLTAPGENYGSVMLKLDLKLKTKDGTEEELHGVAKTLPRDEMARKIFNIGVTVKNEIAMYDTIVPTLQEFQRECGVVNVVDYLPKLYGARVNLAGTDGEVDDHAVLILENLKEAGYTNLDRHVGFDLETAQLILKDLAAFHALPIALKLKKPDVFEKKIKPYLTPFIPPEFPKNGEITETPQSIIVEMLQDSYKCIPYISKVKAILDNERELVKKPPREPFATVVHGDMWINNTMVKVEKGKSVKNKLVDFQVCDYNSPAADLVFFFTTSIQLRVLQDNLDDLIKFYHDHFISHLEKAGCDIRPFSFYNFMDELKFGAPLGLSRALFMTVFVVFAKRPRPSRELPNNGPPDFSKVKESIQLEAKEKIRFIVQTCGKKGWL